MVEATRELAASCETLFAFRKCQSGIGNSLGN